MRDILGLTLVKKKEADQCITMRTQFHLFLSSIPYILDITGNRIKRDDIDTGEVVYEIGEDKFHFNLFPWKFEGFYINDGMVTFYTFIDEALLRRVHITENDADRYQVTEFEKEVLGIIDNEELDIQEQTPYEEEVVDHELEEGAETEDEEHEEKIYE